MSNSTIVTEPIKTVLILTTGSAIVFHLTKLEWVLCISIITGLCGVFSDSISNRIHLIWIKMNGVLGIIVPKIFLSIVFFIALTPISILARIVGNESFLELKNIHKSHFKDSKRDFSKEYFQKPW